MPGTALPFCLRLTMGAKGESSGVQKNTSQLRHPPTQLGTDHLDWKAKWGVNSAKEHLQKGFGTDVRLLARHVCSACMGGVYGSVYGVYGSLSFPNHCRMLDRP